MKTSHTTTEILSQLNTIVHTETKEQSYVFLIKMLAEKFKLLEVMFSVLEVQKGISYSKFFAAWDVTTQSLYQTNKMVIASKIENDFFVKHIKNIEKQPKNQLIVSSEKHEASFRSSIYYFVFKKQNIISETEQNLLCQFLESTVVILSTFFQLAQLTKNMISYEEENDLLREMISTQHTGRSGLKYSYSDITGESEVFLKLLRFLDKVIEFSDRKDLLYIHGESGTGKSMLAQAIHRYSDRNNKSFIEVNCGAIVANLCEAEFFGIAPHSGVANVSKEGKPGLFELADKGVLFLDEISELSLSMQAALLTVIEGKPFRRVCGKNSITVNVRIISASIHDIKKLPSSQFLPELAQRLDGIRIEVPPLRHRKQDIDQLVNYFCEQLSLQRRQNISNEMRKAFKLYNWPGNIRELSNCIRRCSIDGEIPEYLKKLISTEEYPETKTFDELLDTQKKMILKNRIKTILTAKPDATLVDVAKSFGLKRDALRRRLYEVGYTWDSIKQICLDE